MLGTVAMVLGRYLMARYLDLRVTVTRESVLDIQHLVKEAPELACTAAINAFEDKPKDSR